MWMVLFLLSIAGDDAPAAEAAVASAPAPAARCENARRQTVQGRGEAVAPGVRSLAEEPLANAYRPVVRFAQCDRPLIVARRIGQQQR